MSYLNTENIAKSKGGVEYHPLKPFLPEGAKILFWAAFRRSGSGGASTSSILIG